MALSSDISHPLISAKWKNVHVFCISKKNVFFLLFDNREITKDTVNGQKKGRKVNANISAAIYFYAKQKKLVRGPIPTIF